MKGIDWYCFNRNQLPEALFAVESLDSLGGILVDLYETEPTEIAFGYLRDNEISSSSPSLLVMQDNKMAEIFSWLRAYAPETSPLSQFARIITYADFKVFQANRSNDPIYWDKVDGWGSLILGEALSQGDMDISVDKLPLSRAQATFSMAVAKSAITYANNDLTNICIDRLKILEMDSKFVNRSVSILELLPIWQSVSARKGGSSFLMQKFADISINENDLDLFNENSENIYDWRNYSGFLSDSIEGRVIAFKQLESNILNLNFDVKLKHFFGVSSAMAAFLVGRSTSHVFLLKDIAKKIPSVYAWFGLIAGIFGPTYWDVQWSRAAKGIEKSLRYRFDWSEPVHADLSWDEFLWLGKAHRTTTVFNELPKMLPKVLSLEVIPGSVCQFRLNIDDSNHKEIDKDAEKYNYSNYQVKEARSTLISLIELAEKAVKNLSDIGINKEKYINEKYSRRKYEKKSKLDKEEKGKEI